MRRRGLLQYGPSRFDDPEKVLANAKAMLKYGGKVVDVDWKKMQIDFGPPYEVRVASRKQKRCFKTQVSGQRWLKRDPTIT